MNTYGVTHNVTVIHYEKIKSLLSDSGYKDIWNDMFQEKARRNDSGVTVDLWIVDDETYQSLQEWEKRIVSADMLLKNHFEINGLTFIMWNCW